MLAARIGTACTEVKPASVAAAANCGHRAAWALDVGHRDRLPGGIAVQARALVSLQLEQLQMVELFRGGSHQLQLAPAVASSNPPPRHQQLRALLGELGEQVNNVEVVEHCPPARPPVQDANFTR